MSIYPHPALKAPVVCEKCLQLHPLRDFMQEIAIPAADGSLVEGCLICPSCKFKKHTYFLDRATINSRKRIKMQMDRLAASKSPESSQKLKELRKEYQRVFDKCQKKYAEFLEKSVA